MLIPFKITFKFRLNSPPYICAHLVFDLNTVTLLAVTEIQCGLLEVEPTQNLF